MELNEQREAAAKMGLKIASISYDSEAILADFGARKGIGYPMLSDPGSKVIREYGLLNETVPADSLAYGVPWPMILVLDGNGRILAKYGEDDFKTRITAAEILAFRGTPLTAHGATIPAKHASVRLSASTDHVSFGQRILLRAEIELPAGLHAYAPGMNNGYIPVKWALASSPGWVAEEAEYPAPARRTLLGENVLAYEGSLVLQQEITIGSDAAVEPLLNGGRLHVGGTILYQACDETKCFNPEKVAVNWDFGFQKMDRTRAPDSIQHRNRVKN